MSAMPYDQYFIVRKFEKNDVTASTPSDSFNEYWNTPSDPDGVVRDRLNERQRDIENTSTELAFVNQLKPGKILDVGCGPGSFLSAIGSQWKKFGLEVSRPAAQIAKQYGEISTKTLEKSGYTDQYFDVIFCHHVIEHIEDPVSFISELRRILAHDGWLIIATPDFDNGCARKFGKRYRLLKDETHISLFSRESFTRLLRDHGFFIRDMDFPYFDIRYFSADNLLRMIDDDGEQLSPPFYGNLMTFYCNKMSKIQSEERINHILQKHRENFE